MSISAFVIGGERNLNQVGKQAFLSKTGEKNTIFNDV
jgi:hypothetical protein